MNGFPLLSLLVLVPLVGAAITLLISNSALGRVWALAVTVANFALSLVLWFRFDQTSPDYQFVEQAAWIGKSISYHMGVDGISVLFVLLTTALMPLCILASWQSITTRVREYLFAFLLLEALMIGVFTALDMVLFYLFFEAGLIPMYLIIGIWGGPRKIYASFKFFLYTLLGSVLMLLAIMAMYYEVGTTDIPTITAHHFAPALQNWLWLAFFASFAVKMPMWPVHTWLPDAHVEAPTAGSVILAGVLLKMGGYGFLRFSLPMFPDASVHFTPLIFALSVIAVIYTSLVALMQEDMKKLIAYSSVAHMGFVTLGIFTFNQQGVEGAIYQMLSHGIVSAALFLVVGVVYDRIHSRQINDYGGLVNRMPKYALVFSLFTMASIGLPGTGGFVGEFLVLLGAFRANSWVAAGAATGVILGAAYMLWLYRRVIFGELTKDKLKDILDLSPRELTVFAPLVILTLWMGIYPASFLDYIHVSVAHLLDQHHAAVSVVRTALQQGAGQ